MTIVPMVIGFIAQSVNHDFPSVRYPSPTRSGSETDGRACCASVTLLKQVVALLTREFCVLSSTHGAAEPSGNELSRGFQLAAGLASCQGGWRDAAQRRDRRAKYVHASNHLSNKCYLVIEHESTQYVGCLIFQDAATNSPACCANIKGDEGDRRSGAISFCYEPA